MSYSLRTGGQGISNADATQNNAEAVDATNEGKRTFVAVKGLHSEVFENAELVKIDPLRCISAGKLRTRPICRWGVRMIKKSLLGRSDADTFIQGFVITGKFPIIVEIPEEFLHLVEAHFVEQGKSQEAAAALARSGPWYHVVDGGHIHESILQAISECFENFGGFRMPAVIIPWQPEHILRSVAMMCNEMQKDAHFIDYTLPDAMQNLRTIIDSHSKDTGVALVPGKKVKNGIIKQIMAIYAGRPGYADNTMRNVCGIVLKLSTLVVSAMTNLLTEECDDYWQRLGSKRPFGEDTRVYKKLISSQSLKGAKSFLNHDAMLDEDRINVIHRLRFIARDREAFKSFQTAEIESQCRCVIDARTEVSKFEDFLDEESWPTDLENLRQNMLRTTLLDGEIKEHTGAGKQLLPAIADAYVKVTGAHGSQKVAMYCRRLSAQAADRASEDVAESGADKNCGTNADTANGTIDERDQDENACRGGCGAEDEAVNGTRPDTNDEHEEDPQVTLESCGVEIHKMSVTEFERHSVNQVGVFDFVIADPFQKVPHEEDVVAHHQRELDELLDEKGVTLYLQCLRRLVVPGGCIFLFLDWNRLSTWTTCCMSCQFEVICDPFLVMRNPNRMQKMTLKGLQTIYDVALVVKRPGRHPNGFLIDKKSPYVHLPACRVPRWCNVIDGVPPPANRLTFKPSRAHVRPNDRPCALLIEVFQTFCPENGRVLDPRAGVLSTGLACIATNRKCVLLESDERCLSFALPRLQEFAKSKLNGGSPNGGYLHRSEGREEETAVAGEEARTGDESAHQEAPCAAQSSGSDVTNSAAVQDDQSGESINAQTPRNSSQTQDDDSSEESVGTRTPTHNASNCAFEQASTEQASEESRDASKARLSPPISDVSSEGSPPAERGEGLSPRTPESGENLSNGVAQKRLRKVQAAIDSDLGNVALQSPTSFRRLKRTRRRVLRYEK